MQWMLGWAEEQFSLLAIYWCQENQHISVKVTSWEGEGRTQKSRPDSETHLSDWGWDEGLPKAQLSFILKVTRWLKAQ